MKQVISVLVENQYGVLNKITGLFSRRGFNIETLSVGETDDKSVSRITMIVDSGNSVVEQVEKQLNKLVQVIKVRTLDPNELVGKELALFKVGITSKTRGEIKDLVEIMGARIADISSSTVTVEISAAPEQVDLMLDMLRPYGIKEMARTGMAALQKGSSSLS
ncbi:MAG: acetolactate synthase small subunit [Anaerovoracaceae bacterium]|nr:acetolactate synthase small subunit [Bacillota bacterium]MDY2670354.1 acetolactate synthase small subunit [Anaerovoracaceae bacterium]